MRRYLRMMMDTQTEEKYSNERLKLRQKCLKILLNKFEITSESKYSLRDIYECAEEWTLKNKISNGIVDYFEVYFSHKTWELEKQQKD